MVSTYCAALSLEMTPLTTVYYEDQTGSDRSRIKVANRYLHPFGQVRGKQTYHADRDLLGVSRVHEEPRTVQQLL